MPDTLLTQVAGLRACLDAVELPYRLPGAEASRRRAHDLAAQLGGYVLPRLESADAPVLAVVGGSTGAGKSTLVSSLVGRAVVASSAIRPTTRRPVLLHAQGEGHWFETDRVLGTLARVRVDALAAATPPAWVTPRELELRASSQLPAGIALLDAPDVDSVVDDNRALAATLLASADLWVFVTTAARYADAVPWQHLREAAQRDVTVAVVLNRVPPQAQEVEEDLRSRLGAAGLENCPVFVIPETARDEDGLLAPDEVEPVRSWLWSLAADAQARRQVARRTVHGALQAAVAQATQVGDALESQETQRQELAQEAQASHERAGRRVAEAVSDGTLLRGEVLARWQDLVGTGQWLRGLERQVSRLRDRVSSALLGRPTPAAQVEEAIESSVVDLLVAEASGAASQTLRAWRRAGTLPVRTGQAAQWGAGEEDLRERAGELVRGWQAGVMEMVRAEGTDRRLTARVLSYGVGGVGVALMVLVFAHTGGLSGAEVGIAGGTALVAQRLLEAVFGDQAMRTMAKRAYDDLMRRVQELLATQQRAVLKTLPSSAPESGLLREHVRGVEAAVEEWR
ncbi:MAG: dynamin family protein [Actinomyces urogenitalis]|uniref:dynamin family protein n=1 Tax=Actinomyces urogenitalis TaxID=103621 RepID=UPI002A836EA2|nr:dynamin family protein [Actinomyces urogenitalis]MDY3679673.1 dynamin family protein [Actinomyces urogenitalis]